MVQNSAPNSRRTAKNVSPTLWTQRFARASASRLHRKVSLWTLASSALLLSGSLSTRSEANPPGLSPVFASKPTTPQAVSTPSQPVAAPIEAPVVPPIETSTQTATPAAPPVAIAANPAPLNAAPRAAKAPAPILQIDESGAIAALPAAPQSSNSAAQPAATQPVSAPPATLPAISDLEIAPSRPSSPLSSQPQSQPVPTPAEGARDSASDAESADLAVSSAPSPLEATKIAPVPNAAVRPKALAVRPKIRVFVSVGGQEKQAQIAVTPKMTVGQALAAMGISLAVLDRVTPEASVLARDGLKARVTRISADLRTSKRAIPAELRYQPTTKLRAGAKSTLQEAKSGTLEITERVWTRDGKVTKREFVSQRVTAQPQHKIIALGVNTHLLPSNVRPSRRYARALSYRGGSPRDRMLAPADPRTFAAVKSLTVLATGYSAGPAGGAVGNWTATGVRCTRGAVAVDPRLIPLGSKLYVEGYGYGFACDVGGAIKGKHIDLAFDSPGAAMRHGKKQVKVWILGP